MSPAYVDMMIRSLVENGFLIATAPRRYEITPLGGEVFGREKIKFPGARIIMAIEPSRDGGGGLADVIDRILDKGLVINADIAVSVAGVELLGVKIRAALASFETASKYGLEFPSGTNLETPAWNEAMVAKENCPQCEKKVTMEELISTGCPWCGWVSAKAQKVVTGH